MSDHLFQGLITAIITPFRDQKLDFEALAKIIEYQILHQVDGLVVAGSTGEGTSLNLAEHCSLIEAAVQIAQRRILVIAGCCSCHTSGATELAQVSSKAGADGLLCAVPPYVKASQEGLYQHFAAIHQAVELPMMLYSVPSRTAIDLSQATIIRLSLLPRIVALKDADRDLERPLRLRSQLKDDFSLLSGNDEIALSYNAQGGNGCVSVASNVAPKLAKQLQEYCRQGNLAEALKVQQTLLPLYLALFDEPNPVPVKYAMHYLGLCSAEIRLPLTITALATQAKIRRIIDDLSLGNLG